MVLGAGWHTAKDFLPLDLDSFAVESGALTRRRGVRNGERLVRALGLCAAPKATYGSAAALARELGIADLSGPALFKRMVDAEKLMKGLFEHALAHASDRVESWHGYRMLAVDATTLCGPGAKATDQRLHVVYDLGRGLPISVELTDIAGGETFVRHSSFKTGDLVLADAGYGHSKGLMSALHSGAHILVRFNFESLRLFGEDETKIWAEQADGCLPEEGPIEFCAYLENWPAPLRVIGGRNLEGKAVWLLTDLPAEELACEQARSLYSRRWQIELFFKRLKSLVDIDELPTGKGPSARPWIWTKLLIATLAVLIADERFSPWEQGTESLAVSPERALAAA